jgi:hypothetical protein
MQYSELQFIIRKRKPAIKSLKRRKSLFTCFSPAFITLQWQADMSKKGEATFFLLEKQFEK